MGCMIYDTKTALVLRTDLAAWQVANVAAFLAGGLMATNPHMVGEPYLDGAGRFYSALVREPVFVYGGSLDELRRTHQRALSRGRSGRRSTSRRCSRPPTTPTTAPPSPPRRPMRWISSASASTARAR